MATPKQPTVPNPPRRGRGPMPPPTTGDPIQQQPTHGDQTPPVATHRPGGGGWFNPPLPIHHPAPGVPAPPPHVPHPRPHTPRPPVNQAQQSARAIVNHFLSQYGLASLGAWAWERYTALGGGPSAMQQINIEMVEQPQFQKRFPAYKILAERGEAMSPAEMINYEQTARQIFHSAGIPNGFYDQPDDLAKFMVNDVSASELQSRVQMAQSAALTAPQDVKDQLRNFYGLDEGHLTAYFLDPTKAEPLLQQAFTTAQIGAQATRTGFGQLTAAQATHLAQTGVTDATAAQGFAQLGQEQGLFEQQVTGEDQIDQGTQLAAQFDNSAAAQRRIRLRQQARLADFQGNAGESMGAKGVTGLGRSDASSG